MRSAVFFRLVMLSAWCACLAWADEPSRWQLLLVHQDDTPGKVHLAFLRDAQTGLAGHFLVGDKVFGTEWSVSAIGSGNVELKDPAGAMHLLLPAPRPAPAPPAPVPVPPPAPAKPSAIPAPERIAGEPAVGAVVVRTAPPPRAPPRERVVRHDEEFGVDIVAYDPGAPEARYAVSDRDLQRLQEARLRLLAQVALEPVPSAQGKSGGLRVGFAVPAPLVRLLGIRDGDIIASVEGGPVQSLDQMLGIYERLDPRQRSLRAEILRDGRRSVLVLEMDDFPGVKGP